ncbi:MAG: hypothetical protein ACKOQZ_10955, partial [Actinomycetota bacterium]
MRLRAAETAERLVREASADASRIRQEAELEAARKRADASTDVENELELAKQQGRDMVNEAREYRERVLAELARRRELAREQIESLIHARDRLVKAFERARVAANDVVGDLDEFEELSEEVARASQMHAPAQGPVFFDHTKVPDAIPQRNDETVSIETPSQAAEVEIVDEETADVIDDVVAEEEVSVTEPVVEETPVVEASGVETTEETAQKAGHPSVEPASSEHIAEVVQLFGRRETPARENTTESKEPQEPKPVEVEPSEPKPNAKAPAPKRPSVDDLFAKLKQSSPAMVAESAKKVAKTTKSVESKPSTSKPEQPKASAPKPVVPKVNKELFLKSDETLAPQIVSLTRKFKRVLADEENAILTYLQGKKSVVALEKMIPDAATQVQSHVELVADEMHNVALLGAKSVAPGLKADLRKQVSKSAVMQTISKSIDDTIVRPIRERLQRCVEQSNGDREEMSSLVRSAYREW